MPPVALLAALGVLAFLAARKAAADGDIPYPSLFTGEQVQSLTAPEKVQLFSDLHRRMVIDGGKDQGAEVLLFAEPKQLRAGAKAALAKDVVYGANMGAGTSSQHAILVGKSRDGKTVMLADRGRWQDRAAPGSFWNLFLAPGEADHVARAAKVSVGRLEPRALPAVKKTVLHSSTPPLVLQKLIESPAQLAALLIPPAGFSEDTEAHATLSATELPDSLAEIRDSYKKANALYIASNNEGAKAFAPALSQTVIPLRDAGFALASAQIQTLLAKVGAPLDVLSR